MMLFIHKTGFGQRPLESRPGTQQVTTTRHRKVIFGAIENESTTFSIKVIGGK